MSENSFLGESDGGGGGGGGGGVGAFRGTRKNLAMKGGMEFSDSGSCSSSPLGVWRGGATEGQTRKSIPTFLKKEDIKQAALTRSLCVLFVCVDDVLRSNHTTGTDRGGGRGRSLAPVIVLLVGLVVRSGLDGRGGDPVGHGEHELLYHLLVLLRAGLDGGGAAPRTQGARGQCLLEGSKQKREHDVEEGKVGEQQLHTLPGGV